MKKYIGLLLGALLLLCNGCMPTQEPVAVEMPAQAEPVVDTQPEPEEPEAKPVLSSRDCYNIVQNALGTVDVLIMQGESGLEVDGARYYVYIVAEMSGKPVGQIAINENDGALYYYEGEGKLSDYSKMTDRMREIGQEEEETALPLWSGYYTDGAHTLEITYEAGDSLFDYLLDGAQGKAVVIDLQAVSVENDVKFLYLEDGNIQAEGAVQATFVLTEKPEPPAEVPQTEAPAQTEPPAEQTPAQTETPESQAPTEGETTEAPEGEQPTGVPTEGQATEGETTEVPEDEQAPAPTPEPTEPTEPTEPETPAL